MDIDVIIVLGYFAFLIGLGWVFRSAAANTSEYFRGGGKMLWWMVGSSAFMMALSAMTFTGLMGKALTSGMSVAIVFFANALGYFINYLFFAAKARQMRVISPIQAYACVLAVSMSKFLHGLTFLLACFKPLFG